MYLALVNAAPARPEDPGSTGPGSFVIAVAVPLARTLLRFAGCRT